MASRPDGSSNRTIDTTARTTHEDSGNFWGALFAKEPPRIVVIRAYRCYEVARCPVLLPDPPVPAEQVPNPCL
jgi:hypothetical protein